MPAPESPRSSPTGQIGPDARTAVLRAGPARPADGAVGLLAHNAEHWLATHLDAYLRDEDEYRAITRETVIRAASQATIAFTTAAVTVTLVQPRSPRISRALALLIHEINHTPRPPSPATTGRSPTASPGGEAFEDV